MSGSRLGRLLTLGGIVGLSVGAVVAKGSSGSVSGVLAPTSAASTAGGAPATTSASPAVTGRSGTSTTTAGSAGTSATSAAPRKVAGAAESFPFGTIQVEVVLSGRHISDVLVLQSPQGGYSGQVAQFALPTLRNEVLSAQSARIDAVSGASYDSQAYASSVQSALDKAGI